MRLVGAKNSFIRWPFFLEGAWIGLIGAIVPVIIMTLGYHQVYNMFNPQLLRSNYSLIRPEDFIWKVNLLMIATGMIIGSLGSVISMRRFLKRKKLSILESFFRLVLKYLLFNLRVFSVVPTN